MDILLGQLAWWKITDEEINKEASETTSGIKSAKGISALLLFLIAVLNIILVFSNLTPVETIYESILYIVLAVLVYKGYGLAILAAMLLWTTDKALSLYEMGARQSGFISLIVVLLWWAFFMRFFYAAWKIENRRREIRLDSISATNPIAVVKGKLTGWDWKTILLLILAILGGGLLYWFTIRPAQIKGECSRKVLKVSEGQGYSDSALRTGYEFCLHNKGL